MENKQVINDFIGHKIIKIDDDGQIFLENGAVIQTDEFDTCFFPPIGNCLYLGDVVGAE